MINKTDYMKNILQMSYEEKLLLLDRADAWMEAYPSLRAAVSSWEDAPVKDFDDGLLLCSCLRRAHSFIEDAYKFNALKCLDMINLTLEEVVRIARPSGPRTESEKATKKIKAFVPKAPAPDEDGVVVKRTEAERLAMDEEMASDKYRPQNLADYIQLLPQSLQAEARDVKKRYYTPLREARVRLESLTENPDATDEQRAEAANRLAAADDALAEFWQRVDKAYRVVSGTATTDDDKSKKLSDFTKAEIEAIEDEQQREHLKVARIDADKKYLRRSDLPEGDDTASELSLRAAELIAWGVKLSPRQLANMKRYGATLPDETN
jgi:hypothetical protein